MSELIDMRARETGFRRQLLATASAIALLGGVHSAIAADNDKPLVWLELNGQFTQQLTGEDAFSPPFMFASPFDGASHTDLEHAPQMVWDKGGKISFQPSGTDWVFSASIAFGKSSRNEKRDELASQEPGKYFLNNYQNLDAQSSTSHTILDFQVGKDVGLGIFGGDANSTISAGLRYAQFNSRTNIQIRSQPTNAVLTAGYHRFYATFAAKRRFSGLGPSLSWDASANLIGDHSAGHFTFDWGANGSALFGRQRVTIHHQTTHVQIVYNTALGRGEAARIPVYNYSTSPSRDKNVVVPNLGGFAGVSWRYPNAKVSLGYRADFFFGAMDGGVDTAHRENVGFYGPFASVSVGIGG